MEELMHLAEILQISLLGNLIVCIQSLERNIALTTCFTYKTSVGIEAVFTKKELQLHFS